MMLLCASTLALYDGSSKVVQLTAKNFNDLVIQSDDLWLVEFYGTLFDLISINNIQRHGVDTVNN